MSIIFKNNEQILIEIKKVMLETKTTQREIANKLGIKPQGLTKMLNKKNFCFEDAQKILTTMGYNLIIDCKPRNGMEDIPNQLGPNTLTSQDFIDEVTKNLDQHTENRFQ